MCVFQEEVFWHAAGHGRVRNGRAKCGRVAVECGQHETGLPVGPEQAVS